MKRTALLTVLAAALAGCQTPGSQFAQHAHEQLAAAAICCKTLRDAKSIPLPLQQPASLALTPTSQAFAFDDGKAFFEMFELPTFTAPYSILISSQMAGPLQDMSVMAFRVDLLDENFKPIRHFSEDSLRRRGGTLERTVFINPGDQAERYLVVYGSPVETSLSDTVGVLAAQPVFVNGASFTIQTGSEMKSSLHYSPTGSYSIRVDGLQQAAQK